MKNTGPHEFPMKQWIACAPFERLLQIEIIEAEDGKSTLCMPFVIDLAQGAGLMHGGALVSLADTAVVMAIKSVVAPGTHFVTTELHSKFLHPVRQGMVTASAQISLRKDQTFSGKATVFNDKDKPVLEFSSTFKIADNQKTDIE